MSNKIKGSYFPNEDYDFDNANDRIVTFVEMLKSRGCYIAKDGHIRSCKGGLMSKLTRNGYWLTMAQYNRKCYYFCEHRVVWVWHNGAIPNGLVVNHKDYNRSNNCIENLELMTQKENVEYSRPNFNPAKGERSGKSKLTDKQAQAIKTLGRTCGWTNKQIVSLLNIDMSSANIGRIVNGKRYPHIIEAETILEVYPILVDFTRNKSVGLEEELKDYALGLSGEVGELNDLIKKMLYHGKEVQPVDLALEIGDILYYLVAICNVLGFDFSEIALNNNAKLMARYPEGYSIEKSNNRIEDATNLAEASGKLVSKIEKFTSKLCGNGDNR